MRICPRNVYPILCHQAVSLLQKSAAVELDLSQFRSLSCQAAAAQSIRFATVLESYRVCLVAEQGPHPRQRVHSVRAAEAFPGPGHRPAADGFGASHSHRRMT